MCCSTDNCNEKIDPEFKEQSTVPFLERFRENMRADNADGAAQEEDEPTAAEAEGGTAAVKSVGGLVFLAFISCCLW